MDRKLSLLGKENKSLKLPATPNLKRLGYGTGVGVFHIDRSPKDGKFCSPWALKKLMRGNNSARSVMGERLRNEANILKTLNHPNIIGFRAFLCTPDGRECLVMEKCHISLGDLIEERAGVPFPAEISFKVAIEVAKGLDYIHNVVHLLHGDIKSPNILIKGDFDAVKLCDFGVSLPLTPDGHLNRSLAGENATYIGTKIWSAPEVCPEKTEELVITDKADIFSYGLTLWEMMTMVTPFMSDLMDESDCSFDDEKLDELVGTRPEVPDSIRSDKNYEKIIFLFIKCTEYDYRNRISAKEILEFVEVNQ